MFCEVHEPATRCDIRAWSVHPCHLQFHYRPPDRAMYAIPVDRSVFSDVVNNAPSASNDKLINDELTKT
jgi:hypothetical protein